MTLVPSQRGDGGRWTCTPSGVGPSWKPDDSERTVSEGNGVPRRGKPQFFCTVHVVINCGLA